jgi:predicted GNAT superfamily acetyltransferase
MPERRIRIEPLSKTKDFYACEEVQRQAWGMDDSSVVPAHLLITAQKNGGLVLGAFNAEGEVVGFLFGFLGTRETTQVKEAAALRLKHCSHMMGVVPQYRSGGVGYLLKLRQREHVLSQGLDLATWTYEPLESANANLNVCKLGVVCSRYLRDIYGDLPDELNVGLPSDRLEVDWWVASHRVTERIEQGGPKLNLDKTLKAGARLVNRTAKSPDGSLRPTISDLASTAATVLIEIPAHFQAVKRTDMSLALEWRAHTRELFEVYFGSGYVMTEFISETREGFRHSYYILERDFVVP